ncbi:hypothetical protein K470DRAFT_299336 [Piedraia hortae CBS 480.64]|uniref:Uncharacterized protein n=1 Tax=Piedraia hortae CBS 480.64 TaxID=1314780 RepID=A0A6A7C1A2_9PEZI|nr:hypothetical protein K470DRAFT_299336 [Piedraia hortae CBS 480.64]
MHIITGTSDQNSITRDMANAKAAAMNTLYNNYGITFTLRDVSFAINDAWAAGDDSTLDTAKAALRKGTHAILNIFFHSQLAGGKMLGTCTLPSKVYAGAAASVYSNNGRNVNAHTMPGGTMSGTDGCPKDTASISCPEMSTSDNTHNYMDHSSDLGRVRDMWTQFRKGM